MKTKLYIDITNLLNVKFITGIQRVVREVILRFYYNNDYELQLLSYSNEKNSFILLDTSNVVNYLNDKNKNKNTCFTKRIVEIKEIESNSIFFDIDSVWHNEPRRSYLLPILKDHNIRIVVFIHDIIAIKYPNFFNKVTLFNFMNYITAHLKYADMFFTSTFTVANEINALSKKIGLGEKKFQIACPGFDFKACEAINNNKKLMSVINNKKYLLMVGTIEPRKNHKLLLQAYDKYLKESNYAIVFAGKWGWNIEQTRKEIEEHPDYNKNIYHFEGLSDAEINILYKSAFLTIFPSIDEGFGIPIIESIGRKTPVIASRIEVLMETGKEYIDYISPDSPKELADSIFKYEHKEYYLAKKKQLDNFVIPTWDDMYHNIIIGLDTLFKCQYELPDDLELSQGVFLSAREDSILNTLPYIENFMPFIKEIVICCPQSMSYQLRSKYKGNLKLEFLTDEELLDNLTAPDDAETLHFLLRCLSVHKDIIHTNFIMFDDDYRPLTLIDKTIYFNNGKYNAYYFYDMRKWQNQLGRQEDSFSSGAKRTKEFLLKYNYPCLQYSSHMPQIINKHFYLEMLNTHKGIEYKGLCEWSSYFNFCISKYPQLFNVKPYVTLGWPGLITDWEQYIIPPVFLFENYYSWAYEKGRVFEKFSSIYCDNIQEINQEKIILGTENIMEHYKNNIICEKLNYKYQKKYGIYPSIVLVKYKNRIKLFGPNEIEIPKKIFTKLVVSFYGNITGNLKWCLLDQKQNIISNVYEWELTKARKSILIGVTTPNQCINGYLLISLEISYNLKESLLIPLKIV